MTGYFLEKAGEQKDDISEDRVFFREKAGEQKDDISEDRVFLERRQATEGRHI